MRECFKQLLFSSLPLCGLDGFLPLLIGRPQCAKFHDEGLVGTQTGRADAAIPRYATDSTSNGLAAEIARTVRLAACLAARAEDLCLFRPYLPIGGTLGHGRLLRWIVRGLLHFTHRPMSI